MIKSEHYIAALKQPERCGCKADLLFHSDRSEGHNHVITPAREEEEPQNLVIPDLQDTQESVSVRVSENERKINRKQAKTQTANVFVILTE